jgi:hypothetical protein
MSRIKESKEKVQNKGEEEEILICKYQSRESFTRDD